MCGVKEGGGRVYFGVGDAGALVWLSVTGLYGTWLTFCWPTGTALPPALI
jgi:hypothetical protein